MCGIIGISANQSVAQEVYDGLLTLQHRGQDSAGIMTYDGNFNLKKGNGLVRDVFKGRHMIRLKGNIGIGHVRYPTAGSFGSNESQPFFVNSPYGIALIHNGNLTNYDKLKKTVLDKDKRFLNTENDSEVLLNILAHELRQLNADKMTPSQIFSAMKKVFKRLKGAYSVIAMIGGHGLLAFRDSNGFRPLLIGKRSSKKTINDYIFASESVSLDTLGFELVSDVQPGEAVYIDNDNKIHRKICAENINPSPCIFEYIYLARPDSVLDDVSVYKTRLRLGEYMVKKIKKAKLDIDVVMPVPDSSRSAALPLAHQLGVKYREGLVKNRYIGRTFIMPGQKLRKRSIKFKLNPIKLEIKGKNILLVDDSIVRGNTSKKIIEMVRNAGAKNVYFASYASPLISPCFYGVDMPTRKEFIAYNLKIETIAKVLGADKLFYQDVEDMVKAAHEGNPKIKNFCTACFTGEYPTKEITEDYIKMIEETRGKTKRPGQHYDEEKGIEEQLTLL